MDKNRTPWLIRDLLELVRLAWEDEEGTAPHGSAGMPDSSAKELMPVTIALCSMDEALNCELLSTLRRQPLLSKSDSVVRHEGLFTLLTVMEERSYSTPAFDLTASDFKDDWEDLNPAAYPEEGWVDRHRMYADLAEATCAVYLVSADGGWSAADAHAFARLRRVGRHMAIALCLRHGQPVDPDLLDLIFQQTGVHPMTVWHPKDESYLNDGKTPRGVRELVAWMARQSCALAICLAQELPHFRTQIAYDHVRKAALTAALLGAEPAPLLDIPLLLLVQRRLSHHLAAMYEQDAPPLFSQEGAGILTAGVLTRYLAQQLLKLVPFVGWLLSALLSGLSTWLLGMALIRHYEGRAFPYLPIILQHCHNIWETVSSWMRRRAASHSTPTAYDVPITYTLPLKGGNPCSGSDGELPG